jgi:cytochrome c oxidase subunit II
MASRSRVIRYLLAIAPLVLLIVVLSGFKIMGNGPLSTWGTAVGSASQRILDVYVPVFYISIPVFIIVQGVMLAALFKFKRKRNDRLPVQSHGNTKLELVWTLIPALILAGIAVPTFQVIADLATPPGPDATNIRVYAQQWWWAFEYPNDGVVTGDVFHVPVNKPVRLEMVSKDVIHSFWVPALAGKTDLIPGQRNVMWLQADHAGTFRGQCGEYCGLQHAKMDFVVVAESPADFGAWLDAQREPAAEPGDAAAVRGRDVFLTHACAACHAIRGTEALGRVGPDLTHVGGRRTLAGGVLPNTRGYMAGWVSNAQALKPGSYMPTMSLAGDDLQALVAYLESLK